MTGTAFAIISISLGLLTMLVVRMLIRQSDPHRPLIPITIPISWAVMPAAATLLAAWFSRTSFKRVPTIPHVPPVREQVAALPADEILLRGSDAPAAAPTELLRAASGNQTVSAELLLPTEKTTT